MTPFATLTPTPSPSVKISLVGSLGRKVSIFAHSGTARLGLCIKNSPWDCMHMPKMVMNATNILEKKGIFGRDTLHRFLGPFCLLHVMMKFLK